MVGDPGVREQEVTRAESEMRNSRRVRVRMPEIFIGRTAGLSFEDFTSDWTGRFKKSLDAPAFASFVCLKREARKSGLSPRARGFATRTNVIAVRILFLLSCRRRIKYSVPACWLIPEFNDGARGAKLKCDIL